MNDITGTAPPMQALISKLDELSSSDEALLAHELPACLEAALAAADWLPSSLQEVCHERYTRRLVYGDPAGRYSILALVWAPGQASPIHGHRTWCAVGVYGGELTETYFEVAGRAERPVAMSQHPRRRGSCSFDVSDGGVHRIANCGTTPAVSLHIYGVAPDRINDSVNEVYAV